MKKTLNLIAAILFVAALTNMWSCDTNGNPSTSSPSDHETSIPNWTGTYSFTDYNDFKWKVTLNSDGTAKFISEKYIRDYGELTCTSYGTWDTSWDTSME